MNYVLITGSAGLIGSESVKFFSKKGYKVIGIDNDLRKTFFGEEASTEWNLKELQREFPNYDHFSVDIRDSKKIEEIFKKYGSDIAVVIHTAAQPSHDWAARDPQMDFTVNANGTLVLLEATRKYCKEASFIFTSTNKVYGDNPNSLPLVEEEKRWEIDRNHKYYAHGIPETHSIDHCKHSLFGASKASADLLVQEYGKYFGMKTVCFRGGCLTGPNHSGTQLHGFLSYLVKCCVEDIPYTIFGYKGKQVRDNIHSYDLVNMFWHFHQNPKSGEVYNAGGGRHSNCSMIEAIELTERVTEMPLRYTYEETNRSGDHIWWISDISKFKEHFPQWNYKFSLEDIIYEITKRFTNI